MKIMIFNSLYYPYRVGGAEISVQLLAEELVRIGHDVKVITLHEKKSRLEDVLNGVKVVYLPLKNIYWGFPNKTKSKIKKLIWHVRDCYNFGMKKQALAELETFKPDVVHTNNICGFSISVWDAVKKMDIKLVHTSRDYYLFHPNSTLFKNGECMSPNDWSVKVWSLIKKYKSKKVDHYVGISEYIAGLHTTSGYFKKAERKVVYNSVDRKPSVSDVGFFKRIGFIGRLSIEKGFDVFCQLASNYKNVEGISFLAAGNFQNNNEGETLRLMAQESLIKLLGYISLDSFLEQVDVIILPLKWNEPFGRTVVECAMAGKIVITSPMGSMPELRDLLPNVIVTTSMEDDFKEVIEGKIALTTTLQYTNMFSPNKIANQYLDIYK
ncbi:TPA: glycosyltransferase family 4 protein [Klebsiella oxytoca]|uniref:glycosyltransferase family 4 protein n=1 Tax=Klebsiella oxytoca TaxID=571 RepID=UPI0022464BC5|nr:glycosyltransferase family 4 protein [Klebsiella oxytoca]MCW9548455.1 glycosyltransferase family 4 protein [Klebsiella oxytoca]WKM73089.1 glycosyltransferase family 4 protein [Klebsiella oxytoca]HBM3057145.1 glycosyltransferase family 4 protein [Klebsiella oxytoca]HDT4620739.1 glycosyltransferase family 4 protein [Klebsiella oxytoca]HED4267151.1 glycosyltransferase family 4 protein [Klebsiella oxytoca]